MAVAAPFILMAASAAVSAYGAASEGEAAAAEGEAASQIAKQNADAAAAQAGQAEQAQRRRNREFLSMQRASILESGVGYTPTATALVSQSAAEAELDALNIRYEGVLRQQSLMAESAMASRRGKTALKQGYMKAASQLLSTAGKAYGQSGGGGGGFLSMGG